METTGKSYGEGTAYGQAGSSGAGELNVGAVERWGSVALGATFAGLALRRGGATGALLMLSAGVLLLRGVTGHCHAYQALGIDTSGSGEWTPETSGYGSSEGSKYGSSERPDYGSSDRPPEERFGPRVADEGAHEPGSDRTEPYPRG